MMESVLASTHPVQLGIICGVAFANSAALVLLNKHKRSQQRAPQFSWTTRRNAFWALIATCVTTSCVLDRFFAIDGKFILPIKSCLGLSSWTAGSVFFRYQGRAAESNGRGELVVLDSDSSTSFPRCMAREGGRYGRFRHGSDALDSVCGNDPICFLSARCWTIVGPTVQPDASNDAPPSHLQAPSQVPSRIHKQIDSVGAVSRPTFG